MFKKVVLSIAAVSAFAVSSVSAQKYISVGPVVGFGHSNVTNGKMSDLFSIKTKFNPSFNAGVSLIYAKDPHWGFGADLIFSKEGYKKEFSNTIMTYEETNSAGYLRIPLKAYYFFGEYNQKVRPKVYLGPSFGFKVMDDHTTSMALPMGEFNTFDLGIQAGVGANFALGKATWLNVDLNYYQGVLDALKDNLTFVDNGYNMNQNLRLQVGVLFGIGEKKKK